MPDFTPEQEKEFEFRLRYEQEQAAKQAQPKGQAAGRPEATTESVNQIMSGGVGAAAGAMARGVPEQLGNMVRDPVTGKWMALENYGRQMFGGKWYGGENLSDVYQRGYKVTGDPLKGISPDAKLAAQYEAEALKGITPGQKIAAKTPGALKPLLTAPMGAIGRGVMGLGAGIQGADAMNRWDQGDTSGAIISGLGAMGTAASMVPHPVARIGGTAVGLGAEGLNMFLDKLKNKKQMAKGGLVDEEDGLSKAEKAALRIMKSKKKKEVKHFWGGGAVIGLASPINSAIGPEIGAVAPAVTETAPLETVTAAPVTPPVTAPVNNIPVAPPVTPPVTAPVTPPVTAPVTPRPMPTFASPFAVTPRPVGPMPRVDFRTAMKRIPRPRPR